MHNTQASIQNLTNIQSQTHLQYTGVHTTTTINMRKTTADPLKNKAATRPLKKEGASVENEDRHLETINEDEASIPEVYLILVLV